MPTTVIGLFCLALLGGVIQSDVSMSNAFSLNTRHNAVCHSAVQSEPLSLARTSRRVLYMADAEDVSAGDNESAEESASDDAESTEEEEEGPPEDPEVTALKESIAELEATLADKKSKLQYELEQCEEYSKSGYARKVADMENMKRVRSNIASTSQSSATAAVLKDFLPMYDKLNTLKETYAGDEFGSKYSELNLQQTFSTLGVTDFNVDAGETVNNFRMKVLESEVSTEQPKDTVLRQVAPGMELDGNVIRAALCVSSLGVEEEGGEAAEGEEAAEPASE